MYKLNTRELATILAALRYWQRCGEFAGQDILNIATNNGEFKDLAPREIDDLCVRLNCDNTDTVRLYAVTRLLEGRTEVFGAAFYSEADAEEAISVDMEEDDPSCSRDDYEIHEIEIV